MVSASRDGITARLGTPQKPPILRLRSSLMSLSLRHTSTSGWMPMARNSLTECWVGFVLSSPEVPIYGRRVTWM